MRSGLELLVLASVAACRWNFDAQPGTGASGDANGDAIDADVPAFVPYWTSGSRIRARLLVPIEGGDPYWNGWHDTALDMDCRDGIASDGLEHCVRQDVRAGQYFADAGCTQPLAWVRPATCGTATHAYTQDVNNNWSSYPLGAVFAGTVYAKTPGCTVSSGPGVGLGELRMIGTEIAPATLSPGEYRNVQVGDFVRPIQGFPDGAGVEIGTIFTAGTGCFPTADHLGPTACAPNAKRATAVYLDSGCQQRAYYWDRQSYEPATITELVVYDAPACSSDYKFYTVTADVTAPMYFRQTTTGCAGFTTGAIAKLYTATETAANLPAGTVVVGPRRGRLGYLYWVGSDNQPMAIRYWDHDLQMPCLPINASDGKLRCLPAKLQTIKASPDATCSGTPESLTPACFPGPPMDGPDYISCVDSYDVRALPTVGTSASLFEDTCTPLTASSGFYDASTPGAAIDPAIYAEMKEVIE